LVTLVDSALLTSHDASALPQLEDPATVLILLAVTLSGVILILASTALRRATIVISGDDAGRLAIRMLMVAIVVAFMVAIVVTGHSH